MVPHLWHAGLLHGLSVSLVVWSQKGESPDAIVWQATNEARDAIFLADDPQLAFLKAEYHEASPERLARRVVQAALASLMQIAQQVSLTMDRLTVEHRHTTSHHGMPATASLADLFAQADEQLEQRSRFMADQLTLSYADLPTSTVTRITGDDMPPSRGAPPPEGWIR